MKKIKVRISKNPNGGEGKFINKTAAFLYGGTKKARVGMQQDSQAIKNEILDQFTLTNSEEDVIDHLQSTFGLSYVEAEAEIEDVKELLKDAEEKREETEEMIPDSESEEEVIKKEKLYSLTDQWVSDDDSGWDDFDEESDDLAAEDDAALSIEKKGGAVNKKKFVKNIVNGLKKAAEGMEQEQRNANPSILDTPVNGRENFIGSFKRGIKNLGNEFYAKEIYDHTKKLQEEVKSLPSMPMAQDGMEMQQQDVENPMHHLQAYTGSVSNIFNTPMNQIHGAGYEQMPEARRGREQRQERRQQRKMGKDWNRMFGDMAAGYSGVSGLPDYLQFISPQIVQAPQGQQGSGQAPQGPFIDVQYKKGPWWSGKREWSAKGIPAAMLSGMMGAGRGRGVMPGYGYMPAAYGSSYGSSWSTHSTYPGEIVRRKASNVNAVADPGKTSPGLKNNPTTGSYGPGYEGFNADSNGNGIADYLENPNPQGTDVNVTTDTSTDEYVPSFRENILDPENKAYGTQYDFNILQDPENYQSGMFYFKDPKTGQYYQTQSEYPILSMGDENWQPTQVDAEVAARLKHPDKVFGEGYQKPGSDVWEADAEVQGWYSPDDWLQYEYDKNRESYQNIGGDEYFRTNYPEQFAKLKKQQFGGAATGVQPDQFGNLQKFVSGGNGNEMNISPIVYYDNNDISTKDTTDPYYRRGGLVKAADGWTVTGDVKGNTNPQYQSPAFQRFNPNLSEQQNKAAFEYLKSSGTLDPNATYDNTKIYATGQNQGGYKPNVTTRPSGGGYRGGYQYPVQPKGLLEEIRDTFGIFKRNPQTGRNYDFEWMSQRGPIMNAQGQIFQPQRQGTGTGAPQGQGQPNTSGGFQVGDEVRADGSVWRNGVQISDGKGAIMENFGSSGKGQPNQAGYYYDYERVDKPFSHKMTIKGNYIDPNNPSTYGYGSNKQYTGAPFLSNEPYKEQPMQANALNEPKSDSDTRSNDKDSRRDARLDRRIERWDRRAARNEEEYVPMEGSITNYTNPQDFYNAINPVSKEDAQFLGAGYTASEDYQNQGQVKTVRDNDNNWYDRQSKMIPGQKSPSEVEGYYNTQEKKQFGGYMPTFDPGGQFSGVGPFDPNNTSIATGGVGPCTEEAVKNAKPGDPCYNEAYVDSNTPQDFTAEYDINKARTLNLTGVANLGAAAGYAAQGIGQTMENIYDENYLNELTGSDNRDVITYTPTRGGYSGLDQRIGSKGQGRGSTGFNRVVGTDAFTKEGGELKYKKGGVYDLTQEEIGKILAAGGQIKFL
jgi:hypothetical protein